MASKRVRSPGDNTTTTAVASGRFKYPPAESGEKIGQIAFHLTHHKALITLDFSVVFACFSAQNMVHFSYEKCCFDC